MGTLLPSCAFSRWLSSERNPNQATHADDGRHMNQGAQRWLNGGQASQRLQSDGPGWDPEVRGYKSAHIDRTPASESTYGIGEAASRKRAL